MFYLDHLLCILQLIFIPMICAQVRILGLHVLLLVDNYVFFHSPPTCTFIFFFGITSASVFLYMHIRFAMQMQPIVFPHMCSCHTNISARTCVFICPHTELAIWLLLCLKKSCYSWSPGGSLYLNINYSLYVLIYRSFWFFLYTLTSIMYLRHSVFRTKLYT